MATKLGSKGCRCGPWRRSARAAVAALVVPLVLVAAGSSLASAEATLRVLPSPTSGGIEEMSDDGSVVIGPSYLLTPEGVQSLDILHGELYSEIERVSGDGSTLLTRQTNGRHFAFLRDVATLDYIEGLGSEGPFFVSRDGRVAVHGYIELSPEATRQDLDSPNPELWLAIPRPPNLPPWDFAPWTPGVSVFDMSADGDVILGSVAISGLYETEPMLWTLTGGSELIQPLLGLDMETAALSANGRHVALATSPQGDPWTVNELYLMTDVGTPTLLDTSETMLLTVSEVSDDASRILGTREGVHGVWDGTGGFEDLATLVAVAGLDLGAFTQDLQGLDMSPDGRLILGSSSDGTSTQYWIADFGAIPEPGTGLLVAVGLAWLGRRRGRQDK